MDDPTGELRRQREIIAAHLRWLDEQLARSQGQGQAAPTPQPAPPPAAVASQSPLQHAGPAPSAVPTAQEILAGAAASPVVEMPEVDAGSIRNEVRRGCFIYIIGVTVLLAASVAVAVWIAGK